MEAMGKRAGVEPVSAETFVPGDYGTAANWLLSPPRITQLLQIALYNIGRPATRIDAEEALQDFVVSTLPAVLKSYVAADGSFWSYLLVAFRRECWRRGSNLRKRASHEESIVDGETVDNYPQISAQTLLEQTELIEQIEFAGGELDQRAWRAIRLRHFENKSIDEIARDLQESRQNTKVLLHRARHALRSLLQWQYISKLRMRDVTDWLAFCQMMHGDAANDLESIPSRLWSRLSVDATTIAQKVATGQAVDDGGMIALLADINRALCSSDLWPNEFLTRIRRRRDLSTDNRRLLNKRSRGSISTLRLNRLVLEFGFPALIKPACQGNAEHE